MFGECFWDHPSLVDIELARVCARMLQTYVKNSRNLEIFVKSWVPAQARPKGLVFICHGYGDTVTFFNEGEH